MHRMLIICGGENIAESSRLSGDSCIWISNQRNAKTRSDVQHIALCDNVPTTGILFQQMQKLVGKQSNSIYLDAFPRGGEKHFRETVRLFASNISIENAIHHPAISSLAVRHPDTCQLLREAIENALYTDRISEGIEAWIVSWFSDIYGIHRFVGAAVADLVQRHYPTTRVTLNFICAKNLIPPVDTRLSWEQESLVSFIGILADIAFAQQIYHDFPEAVVRFFYTETPPYDYEMVADLVKILTSDVVNGIEVSLVNSRSVPVVLSCLTRLGLRECIGRSWEISPWLYDKLTQRPTASGQLTVRPTPQLDSFLSQIDSHLVVKNAIRKRKQFLSALHFAPTSKEQLMKKVRMLVLLLSEWGIEWSPSSWFVVEGNLIESTRKETAYRRPGSQEWIDELNGRKQVRVEIGSLVGYHEDKGMLSGGLNDALSECAGKIKAVLKPLVVSRGGRERLFSLIKDLVCILAQIEVLLLMERENSKELGKQLSIVHNAMSTERTGAASSGAAFSDLDSSLFPAGVWCGAVFHTTKNNRFVVFPRMPKDNRGVSFLSIRSAFVDNLSGIFAFGFATPADVSDLASVLVCPFVPLVSSAVKEWDEPNTWMTPSGKARMVFAGAVGDPLCLSVLRSVVNDRELEKIREIYPMV